MTEEGKLKILMASSEAVPYAKTGGLADVAGALPRALRARGHDVRLVLPYYGCIRKANLPACDTGISVPVTISGRTETARIWESAMDDGTPVSLIRKDGYYDRDELYGTAEGDYHDNAERFCFFSRAVVALAKRMGIAPDIVHCHDWQTGLVCALLKVVERAHPVFAGTGAVFTIHNLAYQGLFWHYDMHLTGLPWNVFTAEGIEFYGKINLLKAGIVYADAITTVSRRYSEEIQGAELGCGLEGLLARRRGDLHGILNGADYRQWDPASDPHLAARYTPDALEGKARCKEDLLRLFGLNLPPGTPLAGMVGRMADQKGYDLLAAALPGLLDAGLALVILGKGEERYHRLLRHLAKGSSGRLGGQDRLRQRPGAQDRGGGGLLPDAVALRAVRPEPDLQSPLRHGADRPRRRGARRHRLRLRPRDRGGERIQVRPVHRRGVSRRRARGAEDFRARTALDADTAERDGLRLLLGPIRAGVRAGLPRGDPGGPGGGGGGGWGPCLSCGRIRCSGGG